MAILFAGGEFEAFDVVGHFNGSSEGRFSFDTATTAAYDGTYSRGAMVINQSRFLRTEFAALTEGWLHFKFYHNAIDHADVDNWIVKLFKKAGDDHVLGLDATGGTTMIFEYRASGSSYPNIKAFTTGAGNDLVSDTLHTIDIHWLIADSGGIFEIYLDGAFADSFEGDTLIDGYDVIDALEFSNPSDNASHNIHISEVIVADESTIGWHLATLGVTANSATNNAWTNGEPEVDDIGTNDDLTLIRSDTNDLTQGFVADDLTEGDDVIGVVVSARGIVGRSAVQNIQGHTRTGAADFFTTSITGVDNQLLRPVQGIFDTNPDTAAAWTESEVNAAEFGFRSKT